MYNNEASIQGDRMTEEECDRHNDPQISTTAFTLFKLPFVQLESKYQVCCARECFQVAVVQKSPNHLSNCCQVCSASSPALAISFESKPRINSDDNHRLLFSRVGLQSPQMQNFKC